MDAEKRLREIAKEVSYEWEMLCWTFGTLYEEIGEEVAGEEDAPFLAVTHFFGTSLEEREGSALLEPFLLHVRNLRDFLYNDSSPKDDVLATHFFDHPDDWRKKRPPMGEYLKSIRDRLNKALAHISYARLDYRKDRRWNVAKIKHDLKTPWQAFLDTLPSERCQWFRSGGTNQFG